jgi:hypothetical protein
MYLIQYNIWDGSWKVIVTVFAWIVLVKGLAYIFVRKALSETVVTRWRGLFGAYGIIAILVGIYMFFLK